MFCCFSGFPRSVFSSLLFCGIGPFYSASIFFFFLFRLTVPQFLHVFSMSLSVRGNAFFLVPVCCMTAAFCPSFLRSNLLHRILCGSSSLKSISFFRGFYLVLQLVWLLLALGCCGARQPDWQIMGFMPLAISNGCHLLAFGFIGGSCLSLPRLRGHIQVDPAVCAHIVRLLCVLSSLFRRRGVQWNAWQPLFGYRFEGAMDRSRPRFSRPLLVHVMVLHFFFSYKLFSTSLFRGAPRWATLISAAHFSRALP